MQERQARRRERQQVGQVGHRQQQRSAVGQVGGGVRMWSGRYRQRTCGREDDRCQQHDRRIKAQDRGGCRRDDEHHGQQVFGVARAEPRHRDARSAEQAFVVAQLREHQDRGKETDDGQQPVHFGQRLRHRDDAGDDQRGGRRYRDDGLGPAVRAHYGEQQYDDQRDERQAQPTGLRAARA